MKTPITVVRHPREKISKCSLRCLHGHPNFSFLKASDGFSFDATGFVLLEMGAPEISPADAGMPILLLDSTWLLLGKVRAKIKGAPVPRSISQNVKTAYPRVSKIASDPDGLATVEALYAALRAVGDLSPEILKGYVFAKKFLALNGWESDVPPDFFDGETQVF